MRTYNWVWKTSLRKFYLSWKHKVDQVRLNQVKREKRSEGKEVAHAKALRQERDARGPAAV